MNFLIEYILSIIQYFNDYFSYKNFVIVSKILDYTVEDPEKVETGNKFWEAQREKWIPVHSMYSVGIPDGAEYKPIPSGITDCRMNIRYYYNNKVYIYVSDGLDYDWPPKKPSLMKFTMPIKNAVLLNDEGVPVKNITSEVKRFINHFGKFQNPYMYHAKIRLTDVLDRHSFINLRS